jgi:hypothetical protein
MPEVPTATSDLTGGTPRRPPDPDSDGAQARPFISATPGFLELWATQLRILILNLTLGFNLIIQ